MSPRFYPNLQPAAYLRVVSGKKLNYSPAQGGIAMRKIKILAVLVGVGALVSGSVTAHAAACKDDGGRIVVGSGLGAVAGAVVGGASVTVTVAGSSVGLAATCVAFAPACVAGLVVGGVAGAVVGYLSTNRNCAGAFATPNGKWFSVSWNRDSTRKAVDDAAAYCEDETGRPCEVVAWFRHCGALVKQKGGDQWWVRSDATAAGAKREALRACQAKVGHNNCQLSLGPRCNSA